MPGDEDIIEANLYSVFDEINFDLKPQKKKKPRRKHSVDEFGDLPGNF
jgi:hypothetical protein